MGPLWKEVPISRAFSTYLSRSPARKPPPGSLHKAPTERDTPPSELLSTIFQSLVDESTPGCPTEPP